MSEWRWKFYDPEAGYQSVGIYHGDTSGHVVIYQNSDVVIVDFKVFHSKHYSIQFNNTLITLSIEKSEAGYKYVFDREVLNFNPSVLAKFKTYISRISQSP